MGSSVQLPSMPVLACRHDMYNIRLQFAVVNKRQCSIYRGPNATGKPLQTMAYTGPALQSILARQYPDAAEHKLVVLEVPGLPEVFPSFACWPIIENTGFGGSASIM